jgi:branched-chain amino acid transport system substrate-binding protein
MTFPRSYFYKIILPLLPILAIFVLATQCTPSNEMPPLPSTPAGPSLGIALLSPASGEPETFGRVMRNGALMAFDQWNDQGGVINRPVTWQNYDTQCDFAVAQQAAQQAIADGFQYIIGPLCSEAALGAAVAAEAQGVLLITPTAMHSLVTVNGQGQTRPTIFRASYVFAWQGRAAAHFARDTLQAKKAAILTQPGDDYARQVTAAFAEVFTADGGQLVAQTPYPPNSSDFSETLISINQQGADLLYLPAPSPVVNTVAEQLAALKATPGFKDIRLLGSDRWQPDKLNPKVTQGSYFTTHFWPADEGTAAKTWAKAYQASYAVAPDTIAALSYDATNILLTAIEKAQTFEPMAVAHILETEQFAGVTGPMTFDNQHNPHKPVPILYLAPEGLRLVDVILP